MPGSQTITALPNRIPQADPPQNISQVRDRELLDVVEKLAAQGRYRSPVQQLRTRGGTLHTGARHLFRAQLCQGKGVISVKKDMDYSEILADMRRRERCLEKA